MQPAPRIVLALVLILSFGCSKDQPTEHPTTDAPSVAAPVIDGPKQFGGWLVSHMLSDPEQLNPLTSNDSGASSVLGHIFESLLTRDPESLALTPLLATVRPTISDDHLRYRFTLRKDARFSDGKPVTVNDVLFSIKAIKCQYVNAPFTRVYYSSIVDVTADTDGSITFTAAEPYFLNESVLGSISVLPKHYYDPDGLLNAISVPQLDQSDPAIEASAKAFGKQFNENFSRNPMGSGPYRFTEWSTGERVVMDRNPDYWGYTYPDIESPYIDRLLLRVINNTAAALVTLKSGELDTMGLDPLQALRETSSKRFKEQFAKLSYYAPGYTYIGWNNEDRIFNDARVRRAMTMLLDRQAMVKTILFDMGQVIDSPIYRFRPEYDSTLDTPKFDPKAAVALLADAGWKDHDGDGLLDKEINGEAVPFSFEVKINSGNDVRKSVALTMQDAFKRHGIQVKIREIDWTIFLKEIRERNFSAMILGWSMSVNPPDAFQVWHSSQIENHGSNHIAFRNDRVDEILTAYRQEFDAEKRSHMYQEFQQILNREQPYTFLFMREANRAYHRRFQDVKALPIGGPVTDRWWVPSAARKYNPTP